MKPARLLLPSVLLLLLSALGILFGLLVILAAGTEVQSLPLDDELNRIVILSFISLAFFVVLLNFPTLIYATRFMRQKDGRVRRASLYKPASILMVFWFGMLGMGYWASQLAGSRIWLAPLTTLTVVIPVWWIVEFLRRGLSRSTALREWGTLTIGLTVTPLLVMLLEMIMIAILAVVGLIVLSLQPGALEQLVTQLQALRAAHGSMENLESWLVGYFGNPLIVSLVVFSVGFIAPFIEELFKPMAIWFLLKRPLKLSEGYSLGLIAGGAFALMESAGFIIQISFDEWAAAVALRAATGFLHIGLSGIMGYGMVSAWRDQNPARAILYLLGATGLHGLWNVLALVAGLSVPTLSSPAGQTMPIPIPELSVVLMGTVFVALVVITHRLNRKLRTIYITDQSEMHIQ